MPSDRGLFATTAQIPWWVVLLEGIAALVIGGLLLAEPGATLFALVALVGIYWFVDGIVDLVMMFVDHRQWGWKLASGVIGILAGLVVLRHPAWASVLVPALLVWIVGIMGVGMGLIAFVRAFLGGGVASAVLGVISILIGGTLLFNTVVATTVLVYAVGTLAVVGGILAIVGAFLLRGREADVARHPLAPA